MKKYKRLLFEVCPLLAFLFSLVVIFTTIYISKGLSPIFALLCVQVYLNWFSICTISRKATTIVRKHISNDSCAIEINERRANNVLRNSMADSKFWYCDKCRQYTCRPAHHCTFCNKCFHFRDHHCFFIGACILERNMGNFILVCFYTSLACLYSLTVLGPHLYKHLHHFINPNSTFLSLVLNFSFPVALARLLISDEDTCIILVTLFDVLFSVFCTCLVYGAWKLVICITGRQRYYPYIPKKQDLKEIFGSYGLSNIIFPYNGLLGSRDLDGKYELKVV